MRLGGGYHWGTVEQRSSFFAGLAVLLLAACSSSSDASGPPGKGPVKECSTVSDCPTGTAACINSFCVAQECIDNDGDGAGIGPGCTAFDCDDSDPNIPGPEVCGNNKDDDCNGIAEEDCPCLESTGQQLPDGSTAECGGLGPCKGTKTCVSGSWSTTCEGGQSPAPAEICGNGVDDNCSGEEDEGCCADGEAPCPGTAECSSNGICN